MRKLSRSADIVRFPAAPRSFARRPLSSVVGHLTCLQLTRHAETATDLLVSDNDDATSAVWIPKALITVDPIDRGRFIVVTLPRQLAIQKRLSMPIIDREAFLPEERIQLEEAITCASRTRQRLSGQSSNRPTWSGGRNVYA